MAVQVTMYLTEAAVMDVLMQIARLPRGSAITFDFRLKHDLLNPVEQALPVPHSESLVHPLMQ